MAQLFVTQGFYADRNRDACLNARRFDRSLRASIDRRRVIHARDEEIRYPQCSNEPDHARNQEDKNCDLNHSFPGHDFYVLQRGRPRYVTCDAFSLRGGMCPQPAFILRGSVLPDFRCFGRSHTLQKNGDKRLNYFLAAKLHPFLLAKDLLHLNVCNKHPQKSA